MGFILPAPCGPVPKCRTDAEQYAAEGLKANLTSKDYKAVVLGAPSVSSAVTSLKDTVAKKKADMATIMAAAQEEWSELSTSVPPMVEAIQSRVDTLSKSRRLPNNLDKATFETVKTDFDTLKADWTTAGSQFASGAAGFRASGGLRLGFSLPVPARPPCACAPAPGAPPIPSRAAARR